MIKSKAEFHSSIVKVILFALVALVLVQAKVYCASITDFQSNVTLFPDGVLKVREEISVDFEKTDHHNQIIRYIQTRYHRGDDVYDAKVRVHHAIMDGNNETFSVSRKTGNEIQIHIGNDGKSLTGKHKFQLDYEVYKAVNYFKGKPELAFDVTGHHWPFNLKNISCNVELPRGVKDSEVRAFQLIGAPGNYFYNAQPVVDGKISFRNDYIPSGKGMAIAVELPPGAVVLPSVLQDVVWHMQTGYGMILLPSLTVFILAFWWYMTGRSRLSGTEDEGFKPPEYLSACEVGTLVDESCDLTDIVSMVVDLASRGFISIKVLPYNGFLYLCRRDYQLTLLKSYKDKELRPHEQVFLAAIFGASATTYVSELRGRVAEYIPVIRQKVYQSLTQGGYFTRDPENDRRNFIAVGAVVITVGLCLLGASVNHITGVSTSIGLMLSGLVIILGSRTMPKRSALGIKALKQTYNFRNFLAHSDHGRVEEIVKKNPDDFSKYLSYAIVLGVADRWASIYKDVARDYPDWYQIDDSIKNKAEFSAKEFIRELGDGLEIMNRAMTEKTSPFGAINQSNLNKILPVEPKR